jgi:hypothetical protein
VPEPGYASRSRNALLVFVCLLVPFGFVRRRRLGLLLMLGALSGCSNNFELLPLVAPGTYQIPITATDASGASQTASLTLVGTARP